MALLSADQIDSITLAPDADRPATSYDFGPGQIVLVLVAGHTASQPARIVVEGAAKGGCLSPGS